MATYDMTSSSTTGVGADSVALLPGQNTHHFMYNVEAYLDIDDMVAKGVDPDVALAAAKETPAATGNTPVDETVYKCIFCRDVSGTTTQYFVHIEDETLHKATGYDASTLADSDLTREEIETLDATY